MFRRAFVLTAALAFLLSGPSEAQLTVQILKGTAESVPIAIVPFAWEGGGPAPHDVAATVQADLGRSGRFRPLPREQQVEQPHASAEVDTADWRMLKVDYVLVGRLAPLSDGRLEVRYELVSVANGERLLGTALPADPKALQRASHRVADAVYEKILGVRGAFATRIAYVAVDGPVNRRSYRLIVSDSDGANERVVFASPDPIMSPAWSPDGRSLAYVSFHTGLAAVYVQTLATGAQVQVSARSGINGAPSFSPDGSRLALALSRRDGNVDVYVLTLATQDLKRITDDPAIDTEPVWAPDGQSLYFTSDRAGGPQVYRVAVAEGARPKRITYEGSYNARPRISPDGRQLAVVTLDRGAYRIGAVDPGRGALQVLSSGQQDESPSFAPNGADILYTSRVGGRDTLAIVSSDGRVQQRIAASAGELREAAWSPFLD
ncbi:MAG TPA: Tol-Pal system beta propeller repeat protein TolB [Steroidobacteraceae bacterium]|jgi:TolB protein|nr:Tol-Pal system beta propeller repeat protein TolB [Steroidobacteraceae bacterium]